MSSVDADAAANLEAIFSKRHTTQHSTVTQFGIGAECCVICDAFCSIIPGMCVHVAVKIVLCKNARLRFNYNLCCCRVE